MIECKISSLYEYYSSSRVDTIGITRASNRRRFFAGRLPGPKIYKKNGNGPVQQSPVLNLCRFESSCSAAPPRVWMISSTCIYKQAICIWTKMQFTHLNNLRSKKNFICKSINCFVEGHHNRQVSTSSRLQHSLFNTLNTKYYLAI